jgi:hypothetical protein
MKQTLHLLALGLFFYLILLVYHWPAAWVYDQLKIKNLKMENIQGSVWSGKAHKVSFQKKLIGTVKWQLSFADILQGKMGVLVDVDNGHSTASALLTADYEKHLRLEQGQVRASIANLLPYFGPLPVSVSGHALLTLEGTMLNKKLLNLDGKLDLQKVLLPPNTQLGNYHADIKYEKQKIRMDFNDEQAKLALSGNITLSNKGSLRINGTLFARDNSIPELKSMLNFIGRPAPGGKRSFSLKKRSKLRF